MVEITELTKLELHPSFLWPREYRAREKEEGRNRGEEKERR